MNADCAFYIGASHAVCQDYSLTGVFAAADDSTASGSVGGPYVILSDGCSSSPDTDVGARLLVRAAERILNEPGRPPARDLAEAHKAAARLALSWAELLGLRPQAVDATLLTAHLDGDELVVACSGDGVVCLQTRAGDLDAYSVSFPSGYPLYPSYAHQPERLLALEGGGRSRKEVRHFRSAPAGESLQLSEASEGSSTTEVFRVAAADYRYAALFSDGVHSFSRAGGESIPLESVMPDLISFKNTRGAFVRRRVARFLKDCRRKGWQHADDLSVGALHLGG